MTSSQAISTLGMEAVTLDHIDSITVTRKKVRAKEQREFGLLWRLGMAVHLSVFKRSDDELLDDPRVERRLNELLDTVRFHASSLSFHKRFTLRAGELVAGVCLKVNHACTEATLTRSTGSNVVFLEVNRG